MGRKHKEIDLDYFLTVANETQNISLAEVRTGITAINVYLLKQGLKLVSSFELISLDSKKKIRKAFSPKILEEFLYELNTTGNKKAAAKILETDATSLTQVLKSQNKKLIREFSIESKKIGDC